MFGWCIWSPRRKGFTESECITPICQFSPPRLTKSLTSEGISCLGWAMLEIGCLEFRKGVLSLITNYHSLRRPGRQDVRISGHDEFQRLGIAQYKCRASERLQFVGRKCE